MERKQNQKLKKKKNTQRQLLLTTSLTNMNACQHVYSECVMLRHFLMKLFSNVLYFYTKIMFGWRK